MRSRLDRAVLTGSRLRSVALIDVVASGCELSGADWTSARLRRVVFEDCELDEAFLGRGTMRAVRFTGCRLRRADFSGASLARVDLRGSDLEPAGDVSGLRGAIIDGVQLAGIAGHLAGALGIKVDDG